MKKQFNDIDMIEGFLEGSLNDEEREAFYDRIKSDEVFAKALAERKLLQKIYVKASKRNELKKHIQSIVTDEKIKKSNHRKIWLVAASVAGLIGIGAFFLFQSKYSYNNIIHANRENKNNEGLIVTPTEPKTPDYSSVDTLNIENKNIETILPIDGVVFQQSDTILFSRKQNSAKDVLIITDISGFVIKKVLINSGSKEYKLLPYTLKPGKYFWNYSQNAVSRSFEID